jgi:hypothetical protein
MASRFLSEEDQRLAGVLPMADPAAAPAAGEAESDVPDDQLAFGDVAAPAEGAGSGGARSKLVLQSTGQTCTSCGSSDLVRSGTCLTCRTCGATSGCG